ncbi:hypothetical protein JGB39_25555 [Salmonella enterica subsp. enterica serovar Typhimurium]|nr:hypothetical protein [Salmonella enterica subsp. enterica serovar Typhimurium]
MSFRYDVVNTGSFLRNVLPTMVLTEIFIALENTFPDNFPRATISSLLPALPRLIIAPTITGVLLTMLIAIPASIVGDCRASFVPTWTFSSRWHKYTPLTVCI